MFFFKTHTDSLLTQKNMNTSDCCFLCVLEFTANCQWLLLNVPVMGCTQQNLSCINEQPCWLIPFEIFCMHDKLSNQLNKVAIVSLQNYLQILSGEIEATIFRDAHNWYPHTAKITTPTSHLRTTEHIMC